MQAIDRTHRIGQFKPIFATRFIVENSIEERILKLQEKKKLVFDGTVGGDSGSMSKLTVDDMRFLFQWFSLIAVRIVQSVMQISLL